MPKDITFKTSLFGNIAESFSLNASKIMLDALMFIDMQWIKILSMKMGRQLPSIYNKGWNIKYIKEPKGNEDWLDIPKIINNGGGDCEELSAWRAAELRCHGVKASPDIFPSGRGYHVVVRIKGTKGVDKIEDPSKILGMVGNIPSRWYYPSNQPIQNPPWESR